MGERGSHEEALFLEKGMPKATGPPCHHRPQTGGFSQFVPAVTLPTEPPLLTGHVFLIRAICFMGWAIPFSRFHACCFWTPSPWGPFCTSEPPASLASKRNRVLHFNTTDYFKIMFSFPRKRFFVFFFPHALQLRACQNPGPRNKFWKELTSVLLWKGKRQAREWARVLGRTQTGPQTAGHLQCTGLGSGSGQERAGPHLLPQPMAA